MDFFKTTDGRVCIIYAVILVLQLGLAYNIFPSNSALSMLMMISSVYLVGATCWIFFFEGDFIPVSNEYLFGLVHFGTIGIIVYAYVTRG